MTGFYMMGTLVVKRLTTRQLTIFINKTDDWQCPKYVSGIYQKLLDGIFSTSLNPVQLLLLFLKHFCSTMSLNETAKPRFLNSINILYPCHCFFTHCSDNPFTTTVILHFQRMTRKCWHQIWIIGNGTQTSTTKKNSEAVVHMSSSNNFSETIHKIYWKIPVKE